MELIFFVETRIKSLDCLVLVQLFNSILEFEPSQDEEQPHL